MDKIRSEAISGPVNEVLESLYSHHEHVGNCECVNVIVDMAGVFEITIPEFDRAKFIEECGLGISEPAIEDVRI